MSVLIRDMAVIKRRSACDSVKHRPTMDTTLPVEISTISTRYVFRFIFFFAHAFHASVAPCLSLPQNGSDMQKFLEQPATYTPSLYNSNVALPPHFGQRRNLNLSISTHAQLRQPASPSFLRPPSSFRRPHNRCSCRTRPRCSGTRACMPQGTRPAAPSFRR